MNKCAVLKYRVGTGLEQGTSRRSAVECSTTELYPHEYGNK